MKKEIFAIPIFEDVIDLDIFKVPKTPVKETWDSKVKTTFGTKLKVSDTAFKHLSKVISKNLSEAGLMAKSPRFGEIWRNEYGEHDYQDVHCHPRCQWSFIIYETVYSKTSFLNPSIRDIQNQLGEYVPGFDLDYKPNLGPGSIIIFPSFLMHMVNSGNKGSTISGNIYIDYF